MVYPEDGEKENEQEAPHFSWKDVLAFCLAGYQILLPPLLILLASITIVAVLLFVFWLN